MKRVRVRSRAKPPKAVVPLTGRQRKLIEDNWPLACWVVRRMVAKGAIDRREVEEAIDSANQTIVYAARGYRPGLSKFTTYLHASIWKQAIADLRRERARRMVSAARHPARARTGQALAAIREGRNGPEFDVDGEDECARIMGMIERLGRFDRVTASMLKKKAQGMQDKNIARMFHVSCERVRQRLARGRGWLALWLGVRPGGIEAQRGSVTWGRKAKRKYKSKKGAPA